MSRKKSASLGVAVFALLAAASASAEILPETLDRARKGVVTVCAASGSSRRPGSVPFFREETEGSNILGSGIVLSQDGVILTANHVINGVDEISVVLSDLTELRAVLMASEPCLDIALLRVQSAGLSPIPWRTDVAPLVGEPVYAIGTPSVFAGDLTASVSRGIVCGLHRMLDVSGAPDAPFMSDLIETDAQLSPGESGGALVDKEGCLIGMCLAVYYPTGVIRGRSFALAADEWLRGGVDSMLSGGQFPLGYFGVHVSPVSLASARLLGMPAERAVRIAKAGDALTPLTGFQRDDLVTHVAGTRVRRPSEFRRVEMRLVPGGTVQVTVLRGKPPQALELSIVVGRPPSAQARPVEFEWRGMRVRDIDDQLRRELGIPNKTGIAVVAVDAQGPAFSAGLRLGNIIAEVNNTRVGNLAAFQDAVKNIPPSNVVRVRTGEGVGHIQGETYQE